MTVVSRAAGLKVLAFSPKVLRSSHHARVVFSLSMLTSGFLLYCVIGRPWVVQSITAANSGSAVAGSQNLNPDKYVESIWSSKLIPTVDKDAVELTTLLAALKRDPAGTAKRYGNYAIEDGPPAFLVKASGTVQSVDTSGLSAEAHVSLFPGGQLVLVQLGPILTGTDVRDALPFINFNQFVNQVQFGQVALAINSTITNDSLVKLDDSKLSGDHIAFYGAFTLAPGAVQNVTPITLEIGK